jgi:hypothetical protein
MVRHSEIEVGVGMLMVVIVVLVLTERVFVAADLYIGRFLPWSL